ncbi:MAG: TolC family protein [Bacteroidetes bacterium]|nr:TolC family protein [Bacteroidota bacterium]
MKKYSAFVLLFFSLSMYGQVTDSISQQRILTLEHAVNLALEMNTELKVAEMEVKKSEKKLLEAYGGLLPQVNLSGQYQRYIDLPVIFLPPGSPFGTTLKIGAENSYAASASFSVPLFSWALYQSIGIASNALDISKRSYTYTKSKVISDVKKAFLTALLTRETRNVMQQSLKNALDNFENVKRLQRGGTLSDYDVLRAEVQVENLKPVVLQMENNYQLALEQLKVVIGLDARESIDITGEIDFKEPYAIPTQEQVIDELIKNNPQIAILEQQVKINAKTIALERSSYLPTVVGIGSYQYQAQSNDFKFSNYHWVKTTLVGLQVQIPLFNGFKTYARVSQAEIGLQQAERQRKTATEALKTQALSILYRIEQAVKRVQGQNKTVAQAAQGYEIARRRFETGLATQLEVNDAELALRQAKLNRLQAIYDLKIAEAELETVLGKQQ